MNEEREKSNLPPLPTTEGEIARLNKQNGMEVLKEYLLDARQNYPEPYSMLEYKDAKLSTIGGIQALSGQKKNGKTFVLAQLMAAILGTDCPMSRTPQYLPGLRVPERTLDYLRERHKDVNYLPRVLYVDTEMEKLNSAKVLRRVHWLCGWQMDVPSERFHVLWLRSVTDEKDGDKVKERAYQKRYRLIKLAIDVLEPDAVFIDGIRDIIGDFNDNVQSAALVVDLMALAQDKQICIWNTLHMNPRPGNDDESKMRGHLGTELGNKITDTLVSIKHKDSTTGQVTFTVKQMDARDKDIDDWKFEVTDAAGALGIPRIMNTPDPTPPTPEETKKKIELDDILKKCQWLRGGNTYTSIENYLGSQGYTSNRKKQELIEGAKEAGIIYKAKNGKYFYNGIGKELPDNDSDELPFEKPTDEEDAF